MTCTELELQVIQLQRQLSETCDTIDKLVTGSAPGQEQDRATVNRQTLQLLRVQGFDGVNLLHKQGVKA